MKIELNNVLPEPIPKKATEESDLWRSNLILDPGKRHLVSGVSGRGKSTLLQLICGIRDDFSGQLLLDDRDTTNFGKEEWTELRSNRVALMFQDLRLFPNLTARENLELIASQDSHAKAPEKMAALLGVEEFMHIPCGKLSQGQCQRIAIIRVLRRSFELLLLDEPFSHLDDDNTRRACKLIQEEIERRQAGLVLSALSDSTSLSFDRRWKL